MIELFVNSQLAKIQILRLLQCMLNYILINSLDNTAGSQIKVLLDNLGELSLCLSVTSAIVLHC